MRNPTIRIAVIATLLLAIISCYVIFRRNGGFEAPSKPESPPPLTFYFDPATPPALRDFLNNALAEFKLIETNGSETATVATYYALGEAKSSGASLNFYQVWVVTVPYENQQDARSDIITYVSSTIDTSTEPTIRREIYSTNVSPETNAVPQALTTIQELNSSLFVLPVEGVDPLDPQTWTNTRYPLISHTEVTGPQEIMDAIREQITETTFLQDHDYLTELPRPEDFATIAKTGTTVAGGPGWEYCQRATGRLDYPIEQVKNFMSAADIAIISNESSFVEGCTQAAGTTAFCGPMPYFQNLIDMGIDVISLTGNHMCDYGRDAFSTTLSMYDDNVISYYGGGRSITDAWTPRYVETNAGTIAFVGYNAMGPGGVIASDSLPGTAYYDQALFSASIAEASENSDIVWVDTHLWPEYGTAIEAIQTDYTDEAVALGADIVTGVSSHELQGMYFAKQNTPVPVFLGLGNFLFDQMWSDETRIGLALKITLYNKKIARIDLFPTRMYDYCQPRFLTGNDKTNTLEYFFSISDFSEE